MEYQMEKNTTHRRADDGTDNPAATEGNRTIKDKLTEIWTTIVSTEIWLLCLYFFTRVLIHISVHCDFVSDDGSTIKPNLVISVQPHSQGNVLVLVFSLFLLLCWRRYFLKISFIYSRVNCKWNSMKLPRALNIWVTYLPYFLICEEWHSSGVDC